MIDALLKDGNSDETGGKKTNEPYIQENSTGKKKHTEMLCYYVYDSDADRSQKPCARKY